MSSILATSILSRTVRRTASSSSSWGKFIINNNGAKQQHLTTTTTTINENAPLRIGFIGLGHMGSKMVARLVEDGLHVLVYDQNPITAAKGCLQPNSPHTTSKAAKQIPLKKSLLIKLISSNLVFSPCFLPNDAVVTETSATTLLNNHNCTTKGEEGEFLHISSSTTLQYFHLRIINTRGKSAVYIFFPLYSLDPMKSPNDKIRRSLMYKNESNFGLNSIFCE